MPGREPGPGSMAKQRRLRTGAAADERRFDGREPEEGAPMPPRLAAARFTAPRSQRS